MKDDILKKVMFRVIKIFILEEFMEVYVSDLEEFSGYLFRVDW